MIGRGANMAHKCFISFKKEDQRYRDKIDNLFSASDIINKGLDRVIDSNDGDYIMKTIRQDYLKDSTVTVFLIGTHSAENEGCDYWGRRKNYFIERELQASLFNGESNTRNGILGVVLPEMCDQIYKGTYQCQKCNGTHSYVAIDDSTVIREFSVNYYIEPHSGCAWSDDDRYCILVKWDDFVSNPEKYVDMAFEKRTSPVAERVKIRNLR